MMTAKVMEKSGDVMVPAGLSLAVLAAEIERAVDSIDLTMWPLEFQTGVENDKAGVYDEQDSTSG
ncbi:MAG TPA: hypothetical protein VJB57_11235 [Dehalococcoidia bacterium]|nr:hypothetical protein [Dehalococcoidia bacterium]